MNRNSKVFLQIYKWNLNCFFMDATKLVFEQNFKDSWVIFLTGYYFLFKPTKLDCTHCLARVSRLLRFITRHKTLCWLFSYVLPLSHTHSVSLTLCLFLFSYVSRSDPPILQAHNNTDIILRLPMGKRIKDIRWLSVWCRRFTVSPSSLPVLLQCALSLFFFFYFCYCCILLPFLASKRHAPYSHSRRLGEDRKAFCNYIFVI